VQDHLIRMLVNSGYGLSLAIWVWLYGSHWAKAKQAEVEGNRTKRARENQPRSPKDCPACAAQPGQCAEHGQRVVEAWSTRKSKRGRPKQVESDGYCCNNPACVYYGITDGRVHALVSHGRRCKTEAVQYWKCEACQKVSTSRRNTAMYRLHTASQRVQEVTTALGEGVDLAAGTRIFGPDQRTLYRWLERAAQHAQRVHNHFFTDLVCAHLQLDEWVGKVRGQGERVFIGVAIEAQTKIVPVIHLGRRTNDDAQRFVHEVWQRLAKTCIPVFTTDGLRAYYNALTAHFGEWVWSAGKRWSHWQVSPQLLYGQIHKVKVGYRLKTLYTVALCGTRTQLHDALSALQLSGQIMTAYIERFNLTLREHVAPLARRTLALAQDEHRLWMHLEWFRAYYHFALYHQSLRVAIQPSGRYRSRTPTLAAGFARRRWRVSELLLMPIPPA